MIPLSATAALLPLAANANAGPGPSLADLQASTLRAASVVDGCRQSPATCAADERRLQLGRAFYTLVLDAYVHGRQVEATAVSNVRHLDRALFDHLPERVRDGFGVPAGWVVALGHPTVAPDREAMPPAAPEAQPPEEAVEPPGEEAPVALPPSIDGAMARIMGGDAVGATETLHTLAVQGDLEAAFLLARALEEMEMPAAALLVLHDLLDRPQAERPTQTKQVTAHLARLARKIGSLRPLRALAARIPAEAWDASARPDAWLARGAELQERGDLTNALRAYEAIPSDADAFQEGSYRAGKIYRQIGNHGASIDAFRAAWDAQPRMRGRERLQEMAAWNIAGVWEELGQPDVALEVYDVLAMLPNPLARAAVVRSAWAAWAAGDERRALTYLADADRAGPLAEAALLRAQLALLDGRGASALEHLEAAESLARPDDQAVAELLQDTSRLWMAVHPSGQSGLSAAVRERIQADPTVVDLRGELDALAADRATIAAQGPAWRATVGRALDQRLAAEERAARAQATSSLYHVLSAVRREHERLFRRAERLRLGSLR